MIWLFFFLPLVSLYDLHTHRFPNWGTLPLIIAGMFTHLPDSACFPFLLPVWHVVCLLSRRYTLMVGGQRLNG